MRTGIKVQVSAADRIQLDAIVADRNAPQKHVWRAQIVLLTADGCGTAEIMRDAGVSKTAVWRWQERFMTDGVAGLLRDKTRPSRIPPLEPRLWRASSLRPGPIHPARRRTGPPPPWPRFTASVSVRCNASGAGTVCSRIGRVCSSCPTIRSSPAKLREIVGLYVDPPAHAVVLSIDEKSQIQALDRTQPGLPLKKGRCGTMTHDYIRNGTTTLFAALNVLDGKVIGRCMQQHRHQEFIRFLNTVEAAVPAGKLIHGIVDNYATHKHPKVREWLARHPRWTFHFTPTSASWLNAVEGYFAKLTQATTKTWRLPLHRRTPSRHQALPRRNQRGSKTLPLDQGSRQNHRSRQKRAPSVRFYPCSIPAPRRRHERSDAVSALHGLF